MKKLLLGLLFTSSLFAGDTYNMKQCEVIQMSKFTKLFSCHKVDYIVEYKAESDDEQDNIKKIIVVTPNSQTVLKK